MSDQEVQVKIKQIDAMATHPERVKCYQEIVATYLQAKQLQPVKNIVQHCKLAVLKDRSAKGRGTAHCEQASPEHDSEGPDEQIEQRLSS